MATFDPAALDAAFTRVRGQAEAGRVPFTILAVADGAGLIRIEATTEPGRASVPEDACCLVASITKSIVATAAMRLHQDGRFALDAPLAWWLPELAAPDRRQITAWHVLTHTTGIDDPWLDEVVSVGGVKADLVARAMAAPLGAPVGSRHAYASITFDILTLAIERAMDQPFETILRETPLDPLGMVDTDWEPDPARLAPFGVQAWQDDWRPDGRADPAAAEAVRDRLVPLHLAGAGLHSTAADLVRLGRALLRGGEMDGERILASAFVDLMTREVTGDGLGRNENRLMDDRYAIGWRKGGRTSPVSARSFEHGGATGTRLVVDPTHDLVVVYLTGVWALPAQLRDEAINGVYAALR